MELFGPNDLKCIEQLEYKKDLKPGFDAIKGCLIWEDERPDGLSPEGYERLCDLWIARSFVHRNVPESEWGLNPEYFVELWRAALNSRIEWPGFRRLKLSDADRRYFEKSRRELEGSGSL